MHKPTSVRSLEQLGRVRLSPSFFMRDFLHSEIAALHELPNIPDDPTLAIAAGRCLCEQLLEPLQIDLWSAGDPFSLSRSGGERLRERASPELRIERAELCPRDRKLARLRRRPWGSRPVVPKGSVEPPAYHPGLSPGVDL